MHEVLVNRLGGLSLPRKSVDRLTDHPDMTLNAYRGRKTTQQQQQIRYTVEKVTHGNSFLSDVVQDKYSRLTGFDALLIDRMVHYKFRVVL